MNSDTIASHFYASVDLYYHGGGYPQEVLVKKVLSDTKIILHYLYPYQISLENEDFGDCYRYYIFNGGYFTPCFLKNVFYTKCLVQEIMTSEIFSMFFFFSFIWSFKSWFPLWPLFTRMDHVRNKCKIIFKNP